IGARVPRGDAGREHAVRGPAGARQRGAIRGAPRRIPAVSFGDPPGRAVRHVLAALCLAAWVMPEAGRCGEVVARALAGPFRYEGVLAPGARVICVGTRFLAAGSDSVVVAGHRLRRGRDYTIDLAQGCLVLDLAALADSLTFPAPLVVTARALPLGLAPVYTHR